MPPKSTKTASKNAKPAAAKAAPKKAAAVAKVVASNDTGSVTRRSKRGRADSVAEVEETRSKRVKGDDVVSEAKVALPSEKLEKPRELDDETKEKLDGFEESLADHTVRSMGAIMDAIAFGKTRPDTVEGMVEAVLDELKTRALAGKSIEKDIAAVEEVDEKYGEGEYDSDPDGYDKDARRRLNKVEEMVGRLTKMYLKDIMKSLGAYPRGGTNAHIAAEIVGILEYKAQNKSKLVREYKIVKDVYGSCYGCCGDESGLDGSDDEDSEDEDGSDDGEEDEE
ncbi:hypothetical protein DFP72DRAFT_461253 [Ephemerocybe angulata]|uniref:Uncharacterized protein n=1 Tax=Ephemerocybe angulata TaxID=980116 RepID=A0A8H6HSI7_9AGAR|nr:hypothetical protein DFP72DRAFT_461253 [Tulosesus angulatus]